MDMELEKLTAEAIDRINVDWLNAFNALMDRHQGLCSEPISPVNLRDYLLETVDSTARRLILLVPAIPVSVFGSILRSVAVSRANEYATSFDELWFRDYKTRLDAKLFKWDMEACSVRDYGVATVSVQLGATSTTAPLPDQKKRTRKDLLNAWRKKHRRGSLTVEGACEALGVSSRVYYAIINGQALSERFISVEFLEYIAREIGCRPSDLDPSYQANSEVAPKWR